MPGLFLSLFKTEADWAYFAKSNSSCKLAGPDRGCYMASGKMLGGSSSINFMLFVRGPPPNYNDWASLGCPGWSYDDVLPYFKKFEGNQNQSLVDYDNGEYHSATGPVQIQSHNLSGVNQVVFDTLRASGVPIIPEINADQYLGYTVLQSTSYQGQRSSTAREYLSPARNRSNLHVIKHAHVDTIILDENNRATGVQFTYKGLFKYSAYTNKEVIVSGGTMQSAPLLLRSGIGPTEHLEARQIQPRVDSPVGQNFIDHVFVNFIFAQAAPSLPDPPSTYLLDSFYQYAVDSSGPLMEVPYIAGYENIANNSDGQPDIQLFFTQYQKGTPASTVEQFNLFTDFPLFNEVFMNVTATSHLSIMTMSLINPYSRGYIELDDCDGCGNSTVYSNYLTDPRDRMTLVAAIKKHVALRTQNQAFVDIGTQLVHVPIEECDALEYQSDEYWDCYITYCTTSGSHQVGTSKMGNDSTAVVDTELRVIGVEGLRQVDNGV